jgi:lipid-binding SYLF domain-containing protein
MEDFLMRRNMLKRIFLIGLLGLAWAPAWADKFAATLADFKYADGTEQFFSEAYGYALFPSIGKGGFVVGGAFGRGRVYRGGGHSGDTSVAQLSLGFQLGGQAYSQIIFFRNQAAYERFTNGTFEFGAEASAVAITLAAQAKAGTNGAMASGNESSSGDAAVRGTWSEGMVVFTLARGGLMYEASIGGQKFSFQPVAADG